VKNAKLETKTRFEKCECPSIRDGMRTKDRKIDRLNE
jgi:hypothetical protein